MTPEVSSRYTFLTAGLSGSMESTTSWRVSRPYRVRFVWNEVGTYCSFKGFCTTGDYLDWSLILRITLESSDGILADIKDVERLVLVHFRSKIQCHRIPHNAQSLNDVRPVVHFHSHDSRTPTYERNTVRWRSHNVCLVDTQKATIDFGVDQSDTIYAALAWKVVITSHEVAIAIDESARCTLHATFEC